MEADNTNANCLRDIPGSHRCAKCNGALPDDASHYDVVTGKFSCEPDAEVPNKLYRYQTDWTVAHTCWNCKAALSGNMSACWRCSATLPPMPNADVGALATGPYADFWRAVGEYAQACGGDTGVATIGARRMSAVVAVDRAAKAWVEALKQKADG